MLVETKPGWHFGIKTLPRTEGAAMSWRQVEFIVKTDKST